MGFIVNLKPQGHPLRAIIKRDFGNFGPPTPTIGVMSRFLSCLYQKAFGNPIPNMGSVLIIGSFIEGLGLPKCPYNPVSL